MNEYCQMMIELSLIKLNQIELKITYLIADRVNAMR